MLFQFLFFLLGKVLWFVYFAFFPLCLTIALSWFFHSVDFPFVLDSEWTVPALLCFSAFVTGVMAGEKIMRQHGGMGLFLLGMLAQICFAAMAWFDLRVSTFYSHYMPEVRASLIPTIAFALPAIGTMGMVFCRWFILKDD